LNSANTSRYPRLFFLSGLLTCVAYALAFPVEVIVELYSAFGIFNHQPLFDRLREATLAVTALCCILNLFGNMSHWLRLISLHTYVLFFLYINIVLLFYVRELGVVSGDQFVTAGKIYYPFIVYYLIFCSLGSHLVFIKRYKYVVLVSTLAAALTVLQFVDYETLRIDITKYVNKDVIGHYQFIGDALAISFLLNIALFSSRVFKFALGLSAAAVIFLVGSRTSFAVFVLTCLIFILISIRLRWFVALALIISVAVLMFGSTIDFAELEEKNPRMVGIFTEYEEDTSIDAREDLGQLGWNDISNNPIFGRFGGQRNVGTWHDYMHNILSYWRQFGLVPFAMLLFLHLAFAYFSHARRSQHSNTNYAIPFLLGIFLIVESAISRSFAFSYIHLFFGVLISFHAWHTHGENYYIAKTTKKSRKKRRRRRRKKRSSEDKHGLGSA